MNNRGQGLIELVFAIGVIGLVITGVISLLVTSLHSQTSGFDRKKASELGQKVIEGLIEKKNQDPEAFWDKYNLFWDDTSSEPINSSGADYNYKNYTYKKSAKWDVKPNGFSCITGCVEVTVSIGWSGSGIGEEVTLNRLFSKIK